MRQPGLPARDRSGIAVLMVLAVLCVTLAISYALSRTSVTTASLSVHESGGLRARSAAETLVTPPLVNLRSNPNWMPQNATHGTLAADEQYQVTLEICDDGRGRMLDSKVQVYDLADIGASPGRGADSTTAVSSGDRPIADQHLKIRLAKQTLNNLPTAAIAAFESNLSQSSDPAVYIANGNRVRGDVRSKGPIHFQQGFKLEGTARVMGDVTRSGMTSRQYFTYRTCWGSTYQAESLDQHGQPGGARSLQLKNVILGPSSTNPMGVFYFKGDELVLGDNVQINGTVVVLGKLTVRGMGINLIALKQAQVPNDITEPQTLPNDVAAAVTGLAANKSAFLDSFIPILPDDELEYVPSVSSGGYVVNTTFPAVVADGDIVIDSRADVVRISGLILTASNFHRETADQGSLLCGHNHSLAIESILDPFNSVDGPAVYIRGAIMAGRVKLPHRSERPFALVFDPQTTNVRDAPGFFTWRVAEWQDAN